MFFNDFCEYLIERVSPSGISVPIGPRAADGGAQFLGRNAARV
jgi:hypothetical protein